MCQASPSGCNVQYRNVQTMHLRIINAAALAGMPGTINMKKATGKLLPNCLT